LDLFISTIISSSCIDVLVLGLWFFLACEGARTRTKQARKNLQAQNQNIDTSMFWIWTCRFKPYYYLKSSADVISGPYFWSLFPKHPSRMSFRDPISGPSFRNTPPGCHFGTPFLDIRFWYPKFDPVWTTFLTRFGTLFWT